VTGVLPITLGDGTKVVQALLHSGKEYVCVMKLHGDVTVEQIKNVLAQLRMPSISVLLCERQSKDRSARDASTI